MVGHGPVDGLTIVRPVRDHRAEGARDLLEQRADLGGVARLVGGQLAGEDLASAALYREAPCCTDRPVGVGSWAV